MDVVFYLKGIEIAHIEGSLLKIFGDSLKALEKTDRKMIMKWFYNSARLSLQMYDRSRYYSTGQITEGKS